MSTEQFSVQILPTIDRAATYDPDAAPLFGRTLRVALAMRGGVSLAVWIGGAVGELDLLRRIRWTADGRCFFLWRSDDLAGVDDLVFARARIYAEALRAKGYDCAEFDVLAGASAGGLNSVLYSVAQRAGARLDGVLNVWITAGAFWKLMRKPGLKGHDSPLDGDGFFAPGVLEALKALYSDRTAQVASHRAKRVVVDLSATVIDTEDARDRASSQGRAQFHFVGGNHVDADRAEATRLKEHGRGIPVGPDAKTDETDERDATAKVPRDDELQLARLAYAARTTSSLPGGFEPSLIYSSFSPPEENTHSRIDMSFAFHVQRGGFEAPFRVVDGGLTDNIPIDRAFRAIRNMSSEVYSDRVVMYLDPNPPVRALVRTPRDYSGAAASDVLAPPLPPRTDPSSLLLKVVSRALRVRVGKESAEDKAGEIDAYRRQLLLAKGRSRSAVPLSLAAGAIATYDRTLALQEYAQYRVASDANLLVEVLQDPSVWQLGTDLPTRDAFAAIGPDDLADLDSTMTLAYTASSRTPLDLGNAIFAGPGAVVDCCLSLLAWVRDLEDAYFRRTGTTLHVDSRAVASSATPIPGVAEIRSRLYNALDAATRERDFVVRDVCRGVLQYNDLVQPFDPDEIGTRATGLMLVRPSSTMLGLRAELDALTHALQSLTSSPMAPLADSLWAGLPADAGVTALDIAALCAAAGIPESLADVRYWDITAAEPVPDVTKYPALRTEDFRLTLRSILALGRPADIDAAEIARLTAALPLTANAKLNGTAMGAFAGFLSADWRRNDWLWGRLDGASGMLAFLDSIATPQVAALAGYQSVTESENAVSRAHDAILKEASLVQISQVSSPLPGHVRSEFAPFTPLPSRDATPDDLRAALVIGADALTYLNPGYRVATASRAMHLAFGSFGRLRSGAWTLLVTALLRPLGTILPAVVDPPRALFIAAILTGLLTVGSNLGHHTVELQATFTTYDPINVFRHLGWWILPLVVLAVIVLGIRSAVQTHGRWTHIEGMLHDLAVREQVRSYHRRATITGALLFVAGALLLVLTLVANVAGWVPWASTVAGLIAGILLIALSMLQFGRVSVKSAYPVRDGIVAFAACVLFLALAAIPNVFDAAAITIGEFFHTLKIAGRFPSFVNVQHLPVVVGFVALLTSLVMNWGWIAGRLPLAHSDSGSPTALRMVRAWILWFIEGLIAAVAGYFACVIAFLLTQEPELEWSRLVCVLFALVVSGTVQYVLSQLPTGYEPSDTTKRPKKLV